MAQKGLRQESIDADNDMWKARFWQGFQDSVEAAASTGNQKWSKIPSGSKSMHRSVMNGRRMTFDIETLASSDDEEDFETQRIESFVNKLLAFALSTTFDTIESDPASFSAFLDMTSQLRSIQLDRLDLSQPSALCIFANIYHCLLQHALLLTINGLYKKSVGHFFVPLVMKSEATFFIGRTLPLCSSWKHVQACLAEASLHRHSSQVFCLQYLRINLHRSENHLYAEHRRFFFLPSHPGPQV
ncbi:hypothetical protein MHU86_1148 [Fragilaria crotonensis]|nr:hypothetical protein MHU86_1148 [Fragilaria crotonensis]